MENINNLFLQTHKIIENYDIKNRNTSKGFNVFSAVIKNDEVKNSAFIAELLNPQGLHGQENLFLKLFVDLINEKFSKFSLESKINPSKSSVFVEKSIDKEKDENENEKGGFIDIFITDYKNCIVIENKIDAGDQNRQLIRYNNYCKNRNYETTILYLTPNGKSATNESTEDKETGRNLIVNKDYYCLSYQNHIFEWLTACKEKCNCEHLKNIIDNYLNFIVTNFKQHIIMTEITPMLEKNLREAREISENFDSALTSISKALKVAVKEQLDSQLGEKYPQVIISYGEKIKNLRDDYFSSIYIDLFSKRFIIESFNTKGVFYDGGLYIGEFIGLPENPPFSNCFKIVENKEKLFKILDQYGKGENLEKIVNDIVVKVVKFIETFK